MRDEVSPSNEPELPPMMSQDYSEAEDWPGYFASVLGKDARETLIAALDAFDCEGFTGGLGIDIAAGEGRDTLEMLGRGWRVVATMRSRRPSGSCGPGCPRSRGRGSPRRRSTSRTCGCPTATW